MSNASTILLKRSLTPNVIPSVNQLSAGEIFVQVNDGKIFLKQDNGISKNIVQFLNSNDYPYTLNKNLSSIVINYGNNNVTGPLSNILGGYDNLITGAGSVIVNGESNQITSDFGFIGSGFNNAINPDGEYSAILGGQNNKITHKNTFTLGSNLTSHAENFTYVNNISGKFWGDGSNLTNLKWESTYNTVGSLSSNWNTTYRSTTALNLSSSNWNTTFTNVQSNSANWQTAYAYVSANSINLTATNITVNNNLTVTNTVSAKYYQGTILDWMTLVRGYKTVPTLLQTIAGGDVYTYVYATTGTDKTYYRYIANDGSEDSFYGNFSNPTLSNLITKKAIIL